MSDVEKTFVLSVVLPKGVAARVLDQILEGSHFMVVKKITIFTPPGKGKETAAALRALAAEVEDI